MDWQVEKFSSLPSTQDHLKNLLNNNNGLPEGLVICAEQQSHGRGRYARNWQEGAGNLYLSLLIKPRCNINEIGQISLLSGLAILKAMDNDRAILKWANDVFIGDKKCCGILIDASPINKGNIEYLIIGIGVNIKTAPLDTATFLQKHSNIPINAQDFMDKLLSYFAKYYSRWQNEGFAELRAEWLANTYDKGQRISVKINDNKIIGRFEDIDMLGNLILICDNSGKKKKITSGEVFTLNNKE